MINLILKKLGYIKESEFVKKIVNKNRYNSESRTYYLIKINNKPYLFTENNLLVAGNRARRNIEDINEQFK